MIALLFIVVQAAISVPHTTCSDITLGHRHLAAIDNDPNRLQALNCFGNLLTTDDGGDTWNVNLGHCTNRTLQLWRNGTAARTCLLWRDAYRLHTPQHEEHTCTDDGGTTWHNVMDFVALGEHVVKVTAVPGKPERLLAVWMKQSNAGVVPQLISSDDAGAHWQDVAAYINANSLNIVEVFKDGSALLLTGPSQASFTQLVRLNPNHTRTQQVHGPWQHSGAVITQAVVNPLDRRQWLVSSWRQRDNIDRTHITFSAGVTYVEQAMPSRAKWPTEFVDTHGTLLANLRQPIGGGLDTYEAAIYRPAVKAWHTFKLPEDSDQALARGSRIFAMGASKLMGADAQIEGPGTWHQVGDMCPL